MQVADDLRRAETARKLLNELALAGVLRPEGNTRGRKYRLA